MEIPEKLYSYDGVVVKEIYAVGCIENPTSSDPDERTPTCYFSKGVNRCDLILRKAFGVTSCGCRRLVSIWGDNRHFIGVDPINMPDKVSDVNMEFLKPIKF